jgi:ETC complex I subunit conserved region
MLARIYQPAKNAMQSGQAKDAWVLEFEPDSARWADPVMGWTSSTDMKGQIRLIFATKDEAIAYAERQGIQAQVFEPRRRKPIIKAYADNFKFTRKGQWTH